jgi:predicted DNA-binding transcriptional regulator AlpA
MAQSTQTPVVTLINDAINNIEHTTDKLNAHQLPLHGMGRAKDILPFLPFSKTTLFEWSKDGRFPAPVKLSPTMTAWTYASVHEWISKHTSTTSEV